MTAPAPYRLVAPALTDALIAARISDSAPATGGVTTPSYNPNAVSSVGLDGQADPGTTAQGDPPTGTRSLRATLPATQVADLRQHSANTGETVNGIVSRLIAHHVTPAVVRQAGIR